jgi:hypothetical protein
MMHKLRTLNPSGKVGIEALHGRQQRHLSVLRALPVMAMNGLAVCVGNRHE